MGQVEFKLGRRFFTLILLIYRANLDHLVVKGILGSQEKKETLDRLALVDLLVVLVIKGHLELKVQLVQEEIQVRQANLLISK